MRRLPMVAALIFALSSINFAGEDGVVDLRKQFETWGIGRRKQGERNTCSVCVTTSAFEFAAAKGTGEARRLSVDYLNWACNQVIGNKSVDRGQFFHDLLKAEEKYGLCTERLMPYRPKFDADYAPSVEAADNASQFKTNHFRVDWIRKWDGKSGLDDAQMEKVQETLRNGFPVAAGASHSLLLVGYVLNLNEAGGGRFIALDSGSGSYRPLTFEMVRTNTGDAFWVEIPKQR